MPGLFDISSERNQIDVPLTDWRPDFPPFRNPGFPVLENAIPADAGFYRPMPGLVKFGTNTLLDLVSPLTAGVADLRGVRDPDSGDVYYYMMARDSAGGTLHLFQYDESINTWADVTPATPPTATFDSYARFRTFGSRVYAAIGTSSDILAMDIGGAGPFATVTDAPAAKDLLIARGFAIAIDIVDGSGREGTKVTWSAQGDPENWIDPIANPIAALSLLRGFTELEGGGRLQRIVPGLGGADAIIFGQTAIWRMTFIGAPAVWDFRIIAEDEGTTVPTSVIPSNVAIYFYGRRGWMRLSGSGVEPIGAGKVNRAFIRSDVQNGAFRFDPSTQQGLERGMRAALGSEPIDEDLVLWSYRSETDDTFANLATSTGDLLVTDTGDNIQATITSADNDTLLMVNELTGSWGNAKLSLQAIARIDSNSPSTDTPQLVGIDDDFSLVRFTGANLAALFESAEDTGRVNNRVTVRRSWPYSDASDIELSLLSRERLSDAQVASSPLVQEDDAGVPVNESGRYLSMRAEIGAGHSWSFMQGLSVELADQGQGGVS